MRKVILLSSMVMIAPFMAGEAMAQCVATQDCASLGYIETSNTGNCLKCPFGGYWVCPKTEEKAVFGECTGYAKNCDLWQYLNSDGTCTSQLSLDKKPIAIIVHIDERGCGYAVATRKVEKKYQETSWERQGGGYFGDYAVTGDFKSDFVAAKKDFANCENTRRIIEADNSLTYPAAWKAYLYAPDNAPETKGKWCLPAAGLLNSWRDNMEKWGAPSDSSQPLNKALIALGEHGFGYSEDQKMWSSTEADGGNVWMLKLMNTYNSGISSTTKYDSDKDDISYGRQITVRPIIEF